MEPKNFYLFISLPQKKVEIDKKFEFYLFSLNNS